MPEENQPRNSLKTSRGLLIAAAASKKNLVTIFDKSTIKPTRTGLKLIKRAIIIKVGRAFLASYSLIFRIVASPINTNIRIKNILEKSRQRVQALLTMNSSGISGLEGEIGMVIKIFINQLTIAITTEAKRPLTRTNRATIKKKRRIGNLINKVGSQTRKLGISFRNLYKSTKQSSGAVQPHEASTNRKGTNIKNKPNPKIRNRLFLFLDKKLIKFDIKLENFGLLTL